MRPLVIAHRGASGYRPEHTLASYRLAIEQGADFIEPDLVCTRDGVLVARHENELSDSTDVADRPEFADRRTRKRIDGIDREGWFSEDFDLAEIKTLRARERLPALRPGNAAYDGRFEVPTLGEIVQLLRQAEAAGRRVGLYPETKHPTWFAQEGRHLDGRPIGRSLGGLLLETLLAHGFTDPDRVFIQSFELENLIELRRELLPRAGLALPLVQLIAPLEGAGPYDLAWHRQRGDDLQVRYGPLAGVSSYRDLATPAGLQALRASHADAIGPHYRDVLADPQLVRDAATAGLPVHAYTLRAEDGSAARLPDLAAMGVRGVFIDQPDLATAAGGEPPA